MYGLIALIDQSTKSGYDDNKGTAVAGALAHQLRYHVQKSYRYTAAPVVWLGKNPGLVPAGAWPIYILDDPDTAGALGYHDLDPQGNPYGRIFVTPTLDAGVSLSSVLSHEVIEAFVDPHANLWADANHGISYAYEACDAVENSSYLIHGIEVSNFVTRQWFDPNDTTGKVDWLGHLSKPFTMESGGYVIYMQDGKIGQKFAEGYPAWRKELKSAEQPSRTLWRAVREL